MSVVGFLDSIVAAKQNGARYGHSISPNRELVALGAANIVASVIPGTLPAYGSITRYISSSWEWLSAFIGSLVQITHQWRRWCANTNGLPGLLCDRPVHHVLPPFVSLLSSEMCARGDVSDLPRTRHVHLL
jgi:Sulfate permease family